jgi:hypothetical protein
VDEQVKETTEPKDQTKDYDRIIGMLEADTEPTITLDEADYRRYVQDEWDWTSQWKTTNAAYGVEDE